MLPAKSTYWKRTLLTLDHFAEKPAPTMSNVCAAGLSIVDSGWSPLELLTSTRTLIRAMNDGMVASTLPFCRFRDTQSIRVRLSLASTVTVGKTTTNEPFALNGGSAKVCGWPLYSTVHVPPGKAPAVVCSLPTRYRAPSPS